MDVVANDGGQSRGAVGWVWHCCVRAGPGEVYIFEHSRTRVVSISTWINALPKKTHQRDATQWPGYENDREESSPVITADPTGLLQVQMQGAHAAEREGEERPPQ